MEVFPEVFVMEHVVKQEGTGVYSTEPAYDLTYAISRFHPGKCYGYDCI